MSLLSTSRPRLTLASGPIGKVGYNFPELSPKSHCYLRASSLYVIRVKRVPRQVGSTFKVSLCLRPLFVFQEQRNDFDAMMYTLVLWNEVWKKRLPILAKMRLAHSLGFVMESSQLDKALGLIFKQLLRTYKRVVLCLILQWQHQQSSSAAIEGSVHCEGLSIPLAPDPEYLCSCCTAQQVLESLTLCTETSRTLGGGEDRKTVTPIVSDTIYNMSLQLTTSVIGFLATFGCRCATNIHFRSIAKVRTVPSLRTPSSSPPTTTLGTGGLKRTHTEMLSSDASTGASIWTTSHERKP